MAYSTLKTHIFNLFGAAAICLAGGCSDELDLGDSWCPEGEDSSVTLRVNVAEQTVLSRAADTDVKTLWVGVYNATSGVCTGNYLYGSENTSPAEASNQFAVLQNLECKSGKSYIVAVANPVGSTGLDLTGSKTEQPLEELLAAADSWDKFLAVASTTYKADDTHISVGEPTGTMLMEGAYSAAHKAGEAALEIEPVDIRPGAVTLSGAIHLRRLMTQNTLNISAEGDIVSLEVRDIEIYNVPIYSWLHGRAGSTTPAEVTDYANAGDAYSPDGPATSHPAYLTSLKFNPPDAVKLQNGVYTFSFWQYENKRTGLEGCTDYAAREKEYKEAFSNANTGIYSSLSPTAAGDLNNNATYVKITANVVYKDPSHLVNPDVVPPQGEAGLPTEGSSRTATVTYVVHLGYIGGNAKDFNCYRNSKYTYNIKVQSVSDVLVESFKNGEPAPGAEGVVTDVSEPFVELDAHSSAFNIYLTTEEINTFSFTMRTYEYGVAHVVRMYENGVVPIDNPIPDYGTEDFKYYNWIEFVPTGNTDRNRNANVFAKYPAVSDMKPGRTGVYYPGELRNSGLTGQWFTVYVNEYTYEKRIGETGYGDERGTAWKGYVKQPARQAWFNVRQQISEDGESVYFGAKYAFSQRSIQTYYDTDVASCTTALGMEHRNESFGMNLRWIDYDYNGKSTTNGRKNITDVLVNQNWSTAVDLSKQQVINAINNTKQTGMAGVATGQSTTYNVPANVGVTPNGGATYNKEADDNDPQTSSGTAQYLEALKACMNRNRDENGNGTIDREEVKWFLPSSGDYLSVILGRATLPTPLMDYRQAALPFKCENGENTLYHYVSSDAKIIWVEEGASSSDVSTSANWNKAPWQLRCIRSLGTNLSDATIPVVDAAYDDTDKNTTTGGGMVTVSHYYGTALREPTTGALPFHKTDAQENKIALYGFEIAPAGNAFDGSYTYEDPISFGGNVSLTNAGDGGNRYYAEISEAIKNGTLCSKLVTETGRTGWRVPNQKEIIIMMRMGLFKSYVGNRGNSTEALLSCTQEHWANYDTPGSSTLPMSWSYRIVTVNPGYGRATAPHNSEIKAVRCVRDLTQAEAAMSYSALVATNK